MKLKKIIRQEILNALSEEYEPRMNVDKGRPPNPNQKWGSDQYIFRLLDNSGFEKTEKFLRNHSKNRRLYDRFKRHREVFRKYAEKKGKGSVKEAQTLKSFADLFSKIRKDKKILSVLVNKPTPNKRIEWLAVAFQLSYDDAKKMHRHLIPYINNAKNESLQEGYGNSDDEMVWDYKSKKDFPKEVSKLLDKYSKDEAGAIRVLSPHGKGTGLKSNKPKDGIWAYVWRMARFHSGDDPKMPVTAWWDLERGIKEQTGWDVSFTITTTASKRQLKKLDDLVDKVLPKLGKDPYGGARAWRGLVG